MADANGIPNVGGGCHGYQLANASGLNCGVDTDNFLCVSVVNVNFTKTLCCDGEDAYWLFSATTGGNPVGQMELLISTPEGWDTLDGQNWAGLTQQQFLQTAVNTWKTTKDVTEFSMIASMMPASSLPLLQEISR
ncbi:hypothetical protein LTR78_009381 [Recurvomyces mirabilis]|uniref:Uncharacterized protein n=1 Tax=Recurvomyces mirabilis TaxID=574656 RepID=A0AAE0WGJ3_9PEZI|nr:hypothetical protein LTR78_009381 [Recurvomyces mirabilis]